MVVSRVGRKGGTKVFKYGRKSPWVPTLIELFPKIQAVVEHAISCRACGMPIRFPVNMQGIWSISKRRFFILVVACGCQTVHDRRTTQMRVKL